jgi:NitT/TauT family transport system ATP-binding protein
MTPRPGRIAGVLTIELPRPRTPALTESPQFGAQEARLREMLREAGTAQRSIGETGTAGQS